MIRSFSTAIQADPKFKRRTTEARLLYFTLYMHPANHMCGLFSLSIGHMALDLGLPVERTQDALAELKQHGWVDVDDESELVWIPEMAARVGNISDKSPVGKSVVKYLAGFRPCALIKRVSDTLSIPYRYPMAEGIDTLSDRVLTGSVSGSASESGSGTGKDPQTPKGGQSGLFGDDEPPPGNAGKKLMSRKTADHIAVALLTELSVARIRVNKGCSNLDPVEGNLMHIRGLLLSGYTPDQIRHVITVCEERAKRSSKAREHFNAVSPFRPKNVGLWLGMSLEEARNGSGGSESPGMMGTAEAIQRARTDDDYYKSEEYQRQLAEELNGD